MEEYEEYEKYMRTKMRGSVEREFKNRVIDLVSMSDAIDVVLPDHGHFLITNNGSYKEIGDRLETF